MIYLLGAFSELLQFHSSYRFSRRVAVAVGFVMLSEKFDCNIDHSTERDFE